MQRFITILIFVAAVPFAIYVWPTKYAYDQIKLGDSQFPVRIHRMTGEAEFLTLRRPANSPTPRQSER